MLWWTHHISYILPYQIIIWIWRPCRQSINDQVSPWWEKWWSSWKEKNSYDWILPCHHHHHIMMMIDKDVKCWETCRDWRVDAELLPSFHSRKKQRDVNTLQSHDSQLIGNILLLRRRKKAWKSKRRKKESKQEKKKKKRNETIATTTTGFMTTSRPHHISCIIWISLPCQFRPNAFLLSVFTLLVKIPNKK